jgi:hypothetical protein
MTEMFGEEGEAWGELTSYDAFAESAADEGMGAAPGEPSSFPTSIEIAPGMRLVINPRAFRDMMHDPEIVARVAQRAADIADTANDLAVIEGAEYEYVVSNRPENIRARARVRPANAKAYEDDLHNSTLLKALATVGSDPYPWGVSEEGAWQYTGFDEGHADVESEPAHPAHQPHQEGPEGRGYFKGDEEFGPGFGI